MRKVLVLIIALIISINLFACSKDKKDISDIPLDVVEPSIDKILKVALLVNASSKDKGFFDLADKGLEMAKKEFKDKLDYTTLDMSTDETKWKDILHDYSKNPEWDIIIVGTPEMKEILIEVAYLYPEKKYFSFNQDLDFKKDKLANVYAIKYKENEGAFLVGALAGKLSETKIIGFIGEEENQIRDDFLIGYTQGAKYVEKDIKVFVSYIGDNTDISNVEELALSQYKEEGVDVGFSQRPLLGLGQIRAASEVEKFAIGMDFDQALILGEPLANYIPTSLIKNLDLSILRAIGLALNGEITYGASEKLGLSEDAFSLADNEYYKKLVPQEVIAEVEEIRLKIKSGEIEVDTLYLENK